jgi:hypothetical protein
MSGKYLITTDAWFIAPDGKYYRAVWGNVEIVEDNILGVKTNRNSSNWFAKVGSKDNHVLIAGCQIHYAIRCQSQPNNERVMDYHVDSNDNWIEKERPTQIWLAL